MEDSSRPPKDGSLIVDFNAIRGYVCIARRSFTLKESVGLALVDAPAGQRRYPGADL